LNCKKRIVKFCEDQDIPDEDRLNRHHWKILEKLHGALHCYYEATLCSEGNKDIFGKWFSTLDFIFSRTWDAECEFGNLKEANPDRNEYIWLEAAAHCAWLKGEQYYKRTDESAAYYAAEVLQPNRKWSWFHEHWMDDPEKRPWLDTVKSGVQELWKEEYKGKFGNTSTSQ
jgi:hypothetical protein